MNVWDWVFAGVMVSPVVIVPVAFLFLHVWQQSTHAGPRFSVRCRLGMHKWSRMTLKTGLGFVYEYWCCTRCRELQDGLDGRRFSHSSADLHEFMRRIEAVMSTGGSWQVDYDWPLVTPSAEGFAVEDLAAMLGMWQSGVRRAEAQKSPRQE